MDFVVKLSTRVKILDKGVFIWKIVFLRPNCRNSPHYPLLVIIHIAVLRIVMLRQ